MPFLGAERKTDELEGLLGDQGLPQQKNRISRRMNPVSKGSKKRGRERMKKMLSIFLGGGGQSIHSGKHHPHRTIGGGEGQLIASEEAERTTERRVNR